MSDQPVAAEEYTVKVPDVGEGVAEVELVSWAVEVGQSVRRREIVAEVMTDKATVEVPSPIDGTITDLGGSVGDILSVGSMLFTLDTEGDGSAKPVSPPTPPVVTASKPPVGVQQRPHTTGETPAADRPTTATRAPSQRPSVPRNRDQPDRPRATPAVRRRARDGGVDLRLVTGTGPAGRITHDDLDEYEAAPSAGIAARAGRGAARMRRTAVTDEPVVGLRRRIAERMVTATTTIPHITYVDEVDMTALESLRATLNDRAEDSAARLTVLPFLVRAIVNAVVEFPMMNAHVLDAGESGENTAATLRLFEPVHVGIATQTDNGLIVPVLRHAEAETLWSSAERIAELAETTRTGRASAGDLSGSTITISSLGRLGGIVSTPVINKPETAIVGVNKLETRPVWSETAGVFEPRLMMNLSSSFDHRVIDGFDAASFVQSLKTQLEQPALLFVEEGP